MYGAALCGVRARVECELGPHWAVRVAGPHALSPPCGRGPIGRVQGRPCAAGRVFRWASAGAVGSPGLPAWGNTDGQLSNSAEEQRTWWDRRATLKDPGCSGQPRTRLTGHDSSSRALQVRGKPEDVSQHGGHSNGGPSEAATGLDGRSISPYARLRDR